VRSTWQREKQVRRISRTTSGTRTIRASGLSIIPRFPWLLCRPAKARSDGVLLRESNAERNEFRLRIFIPDGTEAEKSGNGLRIFGVTLMARLARIAEERGCGRIEWMVASSKERGFAFYERHHASVRHGG